MNFLAAVEIVHGPAEVQRIKVHRFMRSAVALATRSEETTARARAKQDAALMIRAQRQNRAAQRLLRWAEQLNGDRN